MTTLRGGTFTQPGTSSVNGKYFQPWWFTAGKPESHPRVPVNLVGVPESYKDRDYLTDTVLTVTDFHWPITYLLDREVIQPITRNSSDEAVIIPDPHDLTLWKYVGEGAVTISANSEGCNASRQIVTKGSSAVVRKFNGFRTGSVASAINAAIRNKAEAVVGDFNAKTHLNLFKNTETTPVERNPDFFMGDMDFTCLAVRTSSTGTLGGGTLISPRHIVFAYHLFLYPGTVLYFVTNDDQTILRTVSQAERCVSDIGIGILDADVPESIKFARILPWNPGKIPIPLGLDHESSLYRWPVPVLCGHWDKKMSVEILLDQSEGNVSATIADAGDALRPFHRPLIVGDSGSPLFVALHDEAVLIACWRSGGDSSGSGPYFPQFMADINATMSSLSIQAGASSHYQVTEADISAFGAFP